jgi:anti-sigma regulatory factor (Ser/Thr protein kinase)
VSELVTNAIRAAGPDSPVRLWLRSDGQQLLAEVWDSSDWLPVPQDPDPASVSGRGLLLVDAVSKEWGAFGLGPSAGKIVWATFAG